MAPRTSLPESTLAALAPEFRTKLIGPSDDAYDAFRKVHNGLIDKRPAAIAWCVGVADVIDAVRLGLDSGLEIAVRGGGHNVAGRAGCDGGLMIDLASMKGIHVDPKARSVRAQGGVTWGELNRETQIHDLATTGGVISSAGVAGLTLGGGLGWIMGKHGLSIDTLRSVEIVTAKGEVLVASEAENAELFWGLRGGGGNFGVATSFEFELFPVGPTVTGGLVAFPVDQAREVLAFYRDFTADLPDEFAVFAGLTHAPDGSGTPLAAILACHCETLEDGAAAIEPIKAFGSRAMVEMGPIPYSSLNAMLDAGFPKGALNSWKSNFLTALTDDVIERMVDEFSRCPSEMTGIVIEHFHGAATRVGPADTAFPHRDVGYNILFASQWQDPSQTSNNIAWTRAAYTALEPSMSTGAYVNYLGDDEARDRVKHAYGQNYDRLKRLKIAFDPANVFHLNQNIAPG